MTVAAVGVGAAFVAYKSTEERYGHPMLVYFRVSCEYKQTLRLNNTDFNRNGNLFAVCGPDTCII